MAQCRQYRAILCKSPNRKKAERDTSILLTDFVRPPCWASRLAWRKKRAPAFQSGPFVRSKKSRRYLLSRCRHYHRLGKLNYCVRDGNRCGLSDMVTGKIPKRAGKDSPGRILLLGLMALLSNWVMLRNTQAPKDEFPSFWPFRPLIRELVTRATKAGSRIKSRSKFRTRSELTHHTPTHHSLFAPVFTTRESIR